MRSTLRTGDRSLARRSGRCSASSASTCSTRWRAGSREALASRTIATSNPGAIEDGAEEPGSVVRGARLDFALVFGTGFALGAFRTLFLAPRVGARNAELVELPWRIAACWLAARWIVVRRGLSESGRACGEVGDLALALLLFAEFGVVTTIRGETLSEKIAARDPVPGIAYLVSLLRFAEMPSIVRRRLA